ncbi:hypothetical protein IHE44_0014739 [Lamprotornis superbus]|uniref:Uncharacterized protein n=1 Tax=Lamprotornis superbus TaxID=245042 RepID=A0A835TVG8_9PASS|nr:hypothetical protein IHE44_0014739 [Lamprotornis superbus]
MTSPPMRWDMFFSTPMLPETSSNCSSCCSTINWGQREGKWAITDLLPAAGLEPAHPVYTHPGTRCSANISCEAWAQT